MISDRDLRENQSPAKASLYSIEPTSWEATEVRVVMSSGVVSVGPESSINEVVELMVEHKYSAIPVANELNGSLVGIVSYIDVLRVVQEQGILD